MRPSQSPALARADALLAEAARLRAQGRIAEAVEPMSMAARLKPEDPLLAHDLGLNCLEAGRTSEAATAFKRALALRPRFAEAAWRLGLALETLGDMEAAIGALQQALVMKPSLAEARYRLGLILRDVGRIDEAVAVFGRVRVSAGNSSLGRVAEARALQLQGDDEGVERVARRAVAADPKNAAAFEILGGVHANAGRFEAAAECFERALALSPGMVALWYDLARSRRMTAADAPLIERMRMAARRPELAPGARAIVHLAIGKAMDDLGDYGEAMRAFDAAETARASRVRFDARLWERRIDAMIARFTPERLAAASEMGNPDETPLLILGMPRSGTTLVEQIISSHPDVAGGGELPFWTRQARLLEEAGAEGVAEPFITRAAADYLAAIRALGPTAKRITDKAPFNYAWAGLIHLTFPSATIIHCRRRPIDTALSIHQTWFAEAMNLPTGGEALVGYYRAYERVTAHWRRVLPPDRFVEVDYETLIDEPERQIRRLVAAAGLPWQEACLHPERNARIVKTASKWQARQPINRGSVDRWRRYEPYLGPLAALLDDPPGPSAA